MRYIAKKGFLNYLRKKKYTVLDFLFPILGLPYAYGLILLLNEGFTAFTLSFAIALAVIYFPICWMVVIRKWKRFL